MTKIFNTPFAQDGDKVSPPDSVQADGSVSYPQGYGFDYQRDTSLDSGGEPIDPLAKVFPREQHNGILNDITTAIGEVQKNGFAIWQASAAPYPINAVVRYGDKTWRSLVASNTVIPAENESWTETSGKFVGLGGTSTIQLRAGSGSTAGNVYARLGSSDIGYLWNSGNFDPATKISGDNCPDAGFVNGNQTKPYMRHAPTNQLTYLSPLSDLLALLPKLAFSQNDFIRIPDKPGGLIIQWGSLSVVDDTIVTVTLPTAFPTAFLSAFATPQSDSAVSGNNTLSATAFRRDLSSMRVGLNATPWNPTATVCWFAIGN